VAWIELHQSAAWHRKTIALSKELGVRRNEAFGALATLWLWSVEHAQDGQIGHLTDKEVAAGAGWHGNAARFVLALNKTGWLDDGGYLHDWQDYAGRLIDRRADDLEHRRIRREERAQERAEATAERRRKFRGKSA
jgi:hypothetical protein